MIIVGGESGPGARPFDPAWAHSTVEACKAAGVACFIKQMGSAPIGMPKFKHRSGADPSEWPPELRVQQYPKTLTTE